MDRSLANIQTPTRHIRPLEKNLRAANRLEPGHERRRGNIRPFVEAGVLRSKFNVHWKKDRGMNPDGSERHDECHLTRGERKKRLADALMKLA